ncbi:MAG TPA: hypothetical protein VG125_07140, partial [Pirellulales bacterium]|nr:hypothetical protein [Pirellulales bacterium]
PRPLLKTEWLLAGETLGGSGTFDPTKPLVFGTAAEIAAAENARYGAGFSSNFGVVNGEGKNLDMTALYNAEGWELPPSQQDFMDAQVVVGAAAAIQQAQGVTPATQAAAATAAQQAAVAHQAELRAQWLANPTGPRPAGLAVTPGVLELWGPIFSVSVPKAGQSGTGVPNVLNSQAGWFSFPGTPLAPQVFVSVQDLSKPGGPPSWWVSYGGATDQGFALQVTNNVTGLTHTYTHPQGSILGVVDTGTFA